MPASGCPRRTTDCTPLNSRFTPSRPSNGNFRLPLVAVDLGLPLVCLVVSHDSLQRAANPSDSRIQVDTAYG